MPPKDTHNFVGLSWLILFASFVFWLFTTGEYKQYIPTTRKMFAIGRYYSYGIFRVESHPVPKHREAKHNPVKRLVYLALAALLLPIQMATGFLYWSYNYQKGWELGWLFLPVIDFIHMAVAWLVGMHVSTKSRQLIKRAFHSIWPTILKTQDMWKFLQTLNKNLIVAIPILMVSGFVAGLYITAALLKQLIVPFTFLMIYPMMVTLKIKTVKFASVIFLWKNLTGQVMLQNDPPSFYRASARHAVHGSRRTSLRSDGQNY